MEKKERFIRLYYLTNFKYGEEKGLILLYFGMKYNISEIVYPEGDRQEISHNLYLNQIVDINGYPLGAVKTSKMIAYKVYRKSTQETRNEVITSFFLEQLTVAELDEMIRL